MKHFKKDEFKKRMVHSDHCSQYSSKEFSLLIKGLGARIFTSRVGNSLGNREAKYFFSNLKLECLNHMQTSEMTINKTKVKVAEYIKWFNYNRIQSKLKWKLLP